MQRAPVCTATRPCAVHDRHLADGLLLVVGQQLLERVGRDRPVAHQRETARPVGGLDHDWVATAPTPGSAQLTSEPTPK